MMHHMDRLFHTFVGGVGSTYLSLVALMIRSRLFFKLGSFLLPRGGRGAGTEPKLPKKKKITFLL